MRREKAKAKSWRNPEGVDVYVFEINDKRIFKLNNKI